MTLYYILTGIIALALGLLIGLLISRSQKQKILTETEVLSARLAAEKEHAQAMQEDLNKRITEAKADAEVQLQRAMVEKENNFQELLAEREQHHRVLLEEQQARFDEIMGKTVAELRTTTDTMLKERQKEFAESSQNNLGQIVTPLKETIERMKQAMDQNRISQTAMSSEMKVNIEHMIRQSEAAQKSADELSRVFKHGSKVQGDWGEVILDELLQSQGLTPGRHYDLQPTLRDEKGFAIKNEDGSKLRPDIILHLDNEKEVIIDAKVSMTAFMDYVNAEDEEVRQQSLKAHIESINKHVRELSTKDYSSYIVPPKVRMDYVIMFVPHTGALWTAINSQPDLWRKAMEQNVYIADQQTLYAAIRIIRMTWVQIDQARNHEQVFDLANEMIDRVGKFVKHYDTLGKALKNAHDAYYDGEKKLQERGQSILNTSYKLLSLGAKQNKRNPLPSIDLPSLSTDLDTPNTPDSTEQ